MKRGTRMTCDSLQIICPECNINLLRPERSFDSLSNPICENCSIGVSIIFRCVGNSCKFQRKICMNCDLNKFRQSEKSINSQAVGAFKVPQTKNGKWIFAIPFVILAVCMLWMRFNSSLESSEDLNVALIRRLRRDYPSQKNETWGHILSVLEKTVPTVKSITFLYEGDKKTSHCLTNELISLYTTNDEIKMEEITFSTDRSEVKDYGFSLEHYHAVVEKFRVLITDLTKVSGNVARIFHSLCDEVSSDIKPSLFIFTLKYDKETQSLKPIERAVNILKKEWSSLPQSEISPLLSRIIKNVVDVVPERHLNC